MLHARRGARKHGERLRFRRAFISWENAQGETFLLSPDRPHIIWWYIQSSREWMNRIVRSTDAPHSITDLRQPVLYRMSSGRHIWLPDIIEMIDTCAGYIGRGAPHPGDIVLDAGAFCGESTIELALLVGPTGRVFALEPDPRNIELLKRNLALHHLENVTILPHAIWHETTELNFAANGNAVSTVDSIRNHHAKDSDMIKVSALSPDDLFTQMGCIPNFIKMDIEGAELEVMSVLAPLLAKSPPPTRLAIASYHIRNGRPAHELITPLLEASGFHVETGYPDHVTTWASNS
jgi:FkbM family methyltransferase